MTRWLFVFLCLFVTAACGRTRTPPPPPPEDASADALDGGFDADADAAIRDAALDTRIDSPASECADFGPAACLQNGCVPTYDDTCCPVCEPSGVCADCANPDFYVCRSFEDACMAAFCSLPAPRTCEGALPDCARATPFDEDSCSVPGCVPAVAPLGSPELPPTCVPITAGSCTAVCRIEPPPCPSGTVAEADGSCFTNRCIPASVCE